MKLAGFLAGAGAASLAVFAYGQLTVVTDDDLLSMYLSDHCLPYVTQGTPPFADLGEAPGVYDDITRRDGAVGGDTTLLWDRNFVADWGVLPDEDPGLRYCQISAVRGFEVDPDGFVERYSKVIADFGDLRSDPTALNGTVQTIAWFEDVGRDDAPRGLRVVMATSPGVVSTVLVGDTILD